MLDGVTRPMLPHLPGVPHLHVRACVHGRGGPQVGEVTCVGGVKK